uniref:Putative 39s ribosomal protein l28 mitochondrial n=1 Tax=Anopheles darlingi TaxID=43151 RepID=A0A2M4CH04_ANODA
MQEALERSRAIVAQVEAYQSAQVEKLRAKNAVVIHGVTNGLYSHVGLEKQIRRLVAAGVEVKLAGANEIVLDWSFNGTSIHCGQKMRNLWSIICRLVNTNVLFEVGFFLGTPPHPDALQWFYEEATKMCTTGITLEGENVPLSFRNEIADSQAQTVTAGLQYNICHFGCDQSGRVLGRMMFPISLPQQRDLEATLHTDGIGANVFICEPLNFIFDDIFFDIMKHFSAHSKHCQKVIMFKKLVQMLPAEVDVSSFLEIKTIRELNSAYNELIFFTAILSFQIMYIREHFDLFLKFWTAIFILSDELHMNSINEARDLLSSFVAEFWNLFQRTYLDDDKSIPATTLQWHMLLHLADEVFMKGNLRQNSSAPYDKRILQWKNFGQNKAQEEVLQNVVTESMTSILVPKEETIEADNIVQIGNFRVNTRRMFDRWLFTKDKELIEVKTIHDSKQFLVVKKADKAAAATFSSSIHPIWEKLYIFFYDSSTIPMENGLITLSTEHVLCKMVRLSYYNKTIFYPLSC